MPPPSRRRPKGAVSARPREPARQRGQCRARERVLGGRGGRPDQQHRQRREAGGGHPPWRGDRPGRDGGRPADGRRDSRRPPYLAGQPLDPQHPAGGQHGAPHRRAQPGVRPPGTRSGRRPADSPARCRRGAAPPSPDRSRAVRRARTRRCGRRTGRLAVRWPPGPAGQPSARRSWCPPATPERGPAALDSRAGAPDRAARPPRRRRCAAPETRPPAPGRPRRPAPAPRPGSDRPAPGWRSPSSELATSARVACSARVRRPRPISRSAAPTADHSGQAHRGGRRARQHTEQDDPGADEPTVESGSGGPRPGRTRGRGPGWGSVDGVRDRAGRGPQRRPRARHRPAPPRSSVEDPFEPGRAGPEPRPRPGAVERGDRADPARRRVPLEARAAR